jgi:glutaminyl-tRNA synthetase
MSRVGRSAHADASRPAPPRRAAEAIRDFVKRIGIAKANSVVDAAMFDFSVREVLNRTAQRRMAVLRPLKIVIENYPEGQTEELDAVNHPDDPGAGSRKIRFSRELYVERDDFMENAPKKFYRLTPGKEVRLRYAYFVTCRAAVKNAAGEVVELRCTYDPATRGGNTPPDGRKGAGDAALGVGGGLGAGGGAAVQSTVHPTRSQRRRLRRRPQPQLARGAPRRPPRVRARRQQLTRRRPIRAARATSDRDADSQPGRPVFNRTVGCRDTWAKVSRA